MSLETQPLYVQDFRGGITDHYLAASTNKFKTGNNLVLEPFGDSGNIFKLEIRQGSEIWSTVNPQIPTGAYRIGAMLLFKNSAYNGTTLVNFKDLLIQSSHKMFYVDNELNYAPGTWVTIQSTHYPEIFNSMLSPSEPPPGTPGYINLTNHGFNVGDPFIFNRFGGALAPAPLVNGTTYYVSVIQNANQFEFSATVGGPSIIMTGAFAGHGVGAGTSAYILRPTQNDIFSLSTTVDSFVSMATWKDFVFACTDDTITHPQRVFTAGYGFPIKTQNAGLPRILVANPALAPFTAGPVNNFIYAIFLRATYTTKNGLVTYQDVGPPEFERRFNLANPPNITPQNIGTFAMALHANGQNYPDVEVVVCRTTANGTVFYELGTCPLGETYIDSTPDDGAGGLIYQPLMYTEGGVVSFQEIPPSRFVHIVNDTGYYACTSEIVIGTARTFPNKLIQSIPGVPGSTNGSFFVEFREEIKGVSSYRGTPMVFCDNSVYRIDGQFDELGRGGMFPQELSVEASCISHFSIVQTENGIFWAGKNGFFWSDGYKVRRINEGWPDRYATLVASDQARSRIQGKLDSFNRRIYWTLQEPGQVDCNIIYTLDLNVEFSEDMPFTTMSGFGGGASFAPTTVEFNENTWYRADRRGYILNHNDSSLSDPKIDTSIAVANWIHDPIIYTYESSAHNFGMSFTRYWVPRVILQMKNITNLSLQPDSNNDDTRLVGGLAPIKFRGNTVWGDPSIVWGDNAIIWNLSGFIEAQRRFPAGSLRCSFKQIVLTNAYIILYKSDLWGNATLDTALKTVTLINYPTFSWPTDAINLTISFFSDGYTREFAIINRTANILTFSDAANDAPPSGVTEWVIRGFPLNEKFSLQSYTLHYAPLGKTQPQYQSTDAGGNADG